MKLPTELKEIIQSSNINFLLGSGVSKPFLPTLFGIEENINKSIKEGDLKGQVKGYKEYLEKVMLPNKLIVLNDFKSHKNFKWNSNSKKWRKRTELQSKKALHKTMMSYSRFFQAITKLILERKTRILSKQVNIFTTNIDVFMETVLEKLQFDYNDGFSGRLNPTFSLSNLKKSVLQRSLHFDYKSEIPIYNIYKIHGSLTWKYKRKDDVILSPKLNHFNNTLLSRTGDSFIEKYKNNILVVNPENAKFSETVLNMYYYELLRSYSSELERENSVLFVIGFSMEDKHVRTITQRAANENPTLKIYIFSHSKDGKTDMEKKMQIKNFPNIEIISPVYRGSKNAYKYDLETITKKIFEKINYKKIDEKK